MSSLALTARALAALWVIVLGSIGAAAAQDSATPAVDIQGEVHGLLLMNAFANDEAVNNSDVPQFVLPPALAGGPPASGAGATVRQSRVTASALVQDFAGGQLT